jgi:hypothetical protein
MWLWSAVKSGDQKLNIRILNYLHFQKETICIAGKRPLALGGVRNFGTDDKELF